ncbi:MAG TPA: glycosyltransferase family 2 protein [Candidatus Omnitrophota bacterium]|nr:glycosyltransferase family 2 protein [Candidatus Omnitrophota bacterium]HQO57270.1 glycosyltransferase family 2 protein [Candidatus Omnitrophota bacterium]HQP12283.1 glycosyltransferase family 2 protein [Candidatus Omnitrophota bacterium]
MSRILICPVAFNEDIKLRNAIERFLRSPGRDAYDYLIVDDASTDGTTAMIASFSDRGVKTIRHPSRRGVGAAIRTAIRYAEAEGYDILVIMAGNDKDNPEEIPQLLEPVLNGRVDLVQGSRYLAGKRIGGDMPLYRKWATRLHPLLFSLMTGKKMTDTTNGFRAMRVNLFRDQRILLDQAWLDHYELEPYILYKAVTLGYRVAEVGVSKIYPAKKLGYTKMKPITGWWSILRPLFYLWLGIRK